MPLPTKDRPGHCSVEIYKRQIPGDILVDYWVEESSQIDNPDPNPLDIIAANQTYFVHVRVTMPDAVRRHFCGTLCVDIDVDTCGPAPDKEFPHRSQDLDPCGNGIYHFVFPLPPSTWDAAGFPNRCGRVYKICVTLGSTDKCGNPGLIWGHCDSLEIAVHPAVPVS